MITSYINGNKCQYDGEWQYPDGTSISGIRPCPKCGKMPTPEGYDACLGHIEGAKNACCGHDVYEGCGHDVYEGYIWR